MPHTGLDPAPVPRRRRAPRRGQLRVRACASRSRPKRAASAVMPPGATKLHQPLTATQPDRVGAVPWTEAPGGL